MPDGYAHKYNGQCALNIAGYTPRSYHAFVLGCSGPDLLYFYQMYNPFRKFSMADLGRRMHTEKTGLFLQNMFRFAQTNAQKDYCLGFLCHYSMDSVMHPYVNYITTAYAHPYNREFGHGWFESSLDSHLYHSQHGEAAANPAQYIPEIKKMYLDQIVTLFKQAVEATYQDICYDRSEYTKLFSDYRWIKKALYSPGRLKHSFTRIAELCLGHPKGYIACRMQPCTEPIQDVAMWRNNEMGFFCDSTIEELLGKANQQSADYIKVGLDYFAGIYTIRDLLEDIGNKSYVTGVTIDQ